MKKLLLIFLFFFTFSCSSSKYTYWCGDHACKNNKEKEEYFSKTMIVEIKEVSSKKTKKKSNLDIIKEQNNIVEKNNTDVTSIKTNENWSKEEKSELTEEAKIEENLIKEEERKLTEEAKIEEDLIKEEERKLTEQLKSTEKDNESIFDNNSKPSQVEIASSSFEEIVEKVTKKNSLRPYPDINDIPN